MLVHARCGGDALLCLDKRSNAIFTKSIARNAFMKSLQQCHTEIAAKQSNQQMKKMEIYHATDTMRSLIKDNSQLLMVINRFGISLGFGEKSVDEICEEQSVDAETFLAVANFISGYTESTFLL